MVEWWSPEEGAAPRYRLTEMGLSEVRILARLGSPINEIAEHLGVSHKWLKDYLVDHPEIDEIYRGELASFKRDIRQAQYDLAKVSPPMAVWLGKQFLGQREKQEIEVTKTIHVVGTVPDPKASRENWLHAHAPPEALKALPRPKDEPIEAEFLDLHGVPAAGEG